jgi:clan AA aspartic protease
VGGTYANIKLVNSLDYGKAKNLEIGEDEVREYNSSFLVDTGCVTLCINDAIQEVLQLKKKGTRISVMADGRRIELDVVGPVEIFFEDRNCTTNALLLPNDEEPLLGVIPLEEMDLIVHPQRNTLVGAHPEGPLMKVKSV